MEFAGRTGTCTLHFAKRGVVSCCCPFNLLRSRRCSSEACRGDRLIFDVLASNGSSPFCPHGAAVFLAPSKCPERVHVPRATGQCAIRPRCRLSARISFRTRSNVISDVHSIDLQFCTMPMAISWVAGRNNGWAGRRADPACPTKKKNGWAAPDFSLWSDAAAVLSTGIRGTAGGFRIRCLSRT